VIHVLANLLRNSAEAIRDAQDERIGKISVGFGREGKQHTFEVTDNGVGIPNELKPKIFRTFHTQKTGGLGFGLSYCKTIVEAQGGAITFSSELGIGTTFRVTIPDRA
jgi:two-component system nitrogen regulation sensor histidine kinase NtrY